MRVLQVAAAFLVATLIPLATPAFVGARTDLRETLIQALLGSPGLHHPTQGPEQPGAHMREGEGRYPLPGCGTTAPRRAAGPVLLEADSLTDGRTVLEPG